MLSETFRWGGPVEDDEDDGREGPGPLVDLGGPALGGGGVAPGVGVESPPPFLLIQRLSSGS